VPQCYFIRILSVLLTNLNCFIVYKILPIVCVSGSFIYTSMVELVIVVVSIIMLLIWNTTCMAFEIYGSGQYTVNG